MFYLSFKITNRGQKKLTRYIIMSDCSNSHTSLSNEKLQKSKKIIQAHQHCLTTTLAVETNCDDESR